MRLETHWQALDVGADACERFAAMLSPEESRRASEFRVMVEARRYVVRRGRLRELLAAKLSCAPREVPLMYNRFGKPRLERDRLRFNLSQSGGVALYVISRELEVGCDIEWRQPNLAQWQVAWRLFSEHELRVLETIDPSRWVEAFFNCWTRKEAFVKAIGLGLSYPLKEFDVSLAPGEAAALLRGPAGWSLRSFEPAPYLHAAIAANAATFCVKLSPLAPQMLSSACSTLQLDGSS